MNHKNRTLQQQLCIYKITPHNFLSVIQHRFMYLSAVATCNYEIKPLGNLCNFIEVKLTRSFTSVTLLEGSMVTLSCIPSVIETVLSWTHNGEVVNEDEDTTFSPMNLNHNLTLHNTDVDDSGQYVCHTQLDNEMVEQSITVTVVPGIPIYIRMCVATWYLLV